MTDDPEPVALGHVEFNTAVTLVDQGAGRSGQVPGIDANFGAAPGLQLHVLPSVAYARTRSGHLTAGLGDLETGAKLRLVDQTDGTDWPQIAIYPLVELPTGNAAQGLGAGRVRAFLPVWGQRDWSRWTLFGGGGYWFNRDRRTGDRDYVFAGAVLVRHIDERLALGLELNGQTAPSATLPASTAFNLGGTFDFSETSHLLVSAGRGLSHGDATNRLSVYLALQITG